MTKIHVRLAALAAGAALVAGAAAVGVASARTTAGPIVGRRLSLGSCGVSNIRSERGERIASLLLLRQAGPTTRTTSASPSTSRSWPS